ncbi:MAG: 2-dehydropantoate 2-reductase [Thermodesulfobacteriota bacterium]
MEESQGIQKVMIYGAGGVGGYFGARIAERLNTDTSLACQCAFIARGKHLEVIRRQGITLETPDKIIIGVPAGASDDVNDLPAPDLVLLCVKSYDLDRAIRCLGPRVQEQTVILPLLNGADIRERIRVNLRSGIVLPACVFVGTHIKEPGVISQSGGDGKILLGGDPDRPGFDPAPILRFFDATGILYQWNEDPRPAIFTKYIFIAAFGLTSVLHRKSIGAIMEDAAALATLRAIMEEVAAIAKAKGIALPENIVEASIAKGKIFPFETKTSYLRDVEAKGAMNEGDLYGGTIIRQGKALGVPTPATEAAYARILEG